AVTPNEPIDSLSMGDEHINTIPATESDEVIKSYVENLVPNPITISSKIDSLFDEFVGELTLLKSFPPGINKTDCHPEKEIRLAKRLLYDNSSPRPPEEIVSDISNADIESFSPSPIPNKDITPSEPVDSLSMGDEHLNAILATKSDEFIKSCVENLIPKPKALPNHDSSITISSKIDSLFDEFAGELTLLTLIPPGIDETDCHPEEEISLTKRLLYNNSSPRPPEEIVSNNSNADIESFSPSPIPNKDSDSHMEEIDLYLIWMTQCRRALRMMIMTLKGISR
nr:hypothetical protein [Tanacetum cinerariifolium]